MKPVAPTKSTTRAAGSLEEDVSGRCVDKGSKRLAVAVSASSCHPTRAEISCAVGCGSGSLLL